MIARLAISSLAGLSLVVAPSAGGAPRQVPDFLVFERGGDLYRMTIDASETVRLTTTKAVETSPAVSSDGLRIAFGRRKDELWTMDGRGAFQRRLLRARPRSVRYATTGAPSWTPDAQFVYFHRSAQGPNEICGWIYRIRADGRGLRQVTRGVGLDTAPAVSPDGRRIAFITGGCQPTSECCSVGVVDPAGRPARELAKLPDRFTYEEIAWSPDGSRVALEVSDLDTDPLGIFVARRDGSGLRRLTPRGIYGEDPAWSPDGESIAFAAWTVTRSYDLYTIRSDGGELRQVTRTPGTEHSPDWIPRS
jgi:TolB protein